MVGNRVVCSHGPGVRGDVVHLYVPVGTHNAPPSDAVNLTVEIDRGMPVGGDSIRRQAGVIGIADRVVAPKRGGGIGVLIIAAKQVNVRAITDRGQPVASGRQRSNRAPAIGRWAVLVRVCYNGGVGDTSETIDVATY